jgi:hypothetical protein
MQHQTLDAWEQRIQTLKEWVRTRKETVLADLKTADWPWPEKSVCVNDLTMAGALARNCSRLCGASAGTTASGPRSESESGSGLLCGLIPDEFLYQPKLFDSACQAKCRESPPVCDACSVGHKRNTEGRACEFSCFTEGGPCHAALLGWTPTIKAEARAELLQLQPAIGGNDDDNRGGDGNGTNAAAASTAIGTSTSTAAGGRQSSSTHSSELKLPLPSGIGIPSSERVGIVLNIDERAMAMPPAPAPASAPAPSALVGVVVFAFALAAVAAVSGGSAHVSLIRRSHSDT